MELRRDPAGARPAGIGRSRQARAVTWPPTAAEVTHACHKDTEWLLDCLMDFASRNVLSSELGFGSMCRTKFSFVHVSVFLAETRKEIQPNVWGA